ncbi:MAG: hypothetical protein LBU42_02900 [Prevotellaceae bacterium]|jgi:hypothetical protein|nr:hypothetical protein [Prevotellaceae bacterium]
MKKIFFLLAMLASVAANATVKVTPLSTDYSTNKVTFKVEWTNTPSAPYNNRVWVWIDFYPVTGATPANSFSAATISNPTRTGGNGTVTNATERGFFIEYAAINAGTTVTATLSNASGKFNWCAYGSDYPPNVLANTNSSYTLAGTLPFKLIASNSAASLTVPGTTIATSAVTFAPATITDATGYPGLWCPYTGSDLYMDISHRCMQRQSGAQNWEAYIKDNRDDQIYRITQFSDDSWWFADDLAIASKLYCTCNGSPNYKSNDKPTCPTGWIIPTRQQVNDRYTIAFNTNNWNDPFGASITQAYWCNPNCHKSSTYNEISMLVSDFNSCVHYWYNSSWHCTSENCNYGDGGLIRCFRQL